MIIMIEVDVVNDNEDESLMIIMIEVDVVNDNEDESWCCC